MTSSAIPTIPTINYYAIPATLPLAAVFPVHASDTPRLKADCKFENVFRLSLKWRTTENSFIDLVSGTSGDREAA